MKRRFAAEITLALATTLLINAPALTEAFVHGETDGALIESMEVGGEDELRYIGKMREAAEGRWLMSNPVLKEHRDESFSPSGFLEWIPAVLLRVFGGDMGYVLLLTDVLFSAITVTLTLLWLKRVIPSRIIVACCMLLLFFTDFGGSLHGLLRDTVPKFVQPLMSLYLLLLTFPNARSPRATLLRGALIGCMFYTYPYHWSLCLVTEGAFLIRHVLLTHPLAKRRDLSIAYVKKSCRTGLAHGMLTLLPFAIIAAPIAIAMRRMLSMPEFADFYSRYHIVYTRIPAAPALQATVLCAILALAACVLWRARRAHEPARQTIEELAPLLLPLIGMMILLNANVITGKDPELLGHGGRVIMPVVVIAYATVLARILPKRIITLAGSAALVVFLFSAVHGASVRTDALREHVTAWNAAPEKSALTWLDAHLPAESIVAAPRAVAEKIPAFTSHYSFFGAGAHFFFVSLDELTDRYLGWVGLYPEEQEPTDTATVIIFGNHPGAQWSKERTWNALLGRPFEKTMADYIPRQDLRRLIDEEHAHPDDARTAERLRRYDAEAIVLREGHGLRANILRGFTRATTIAPYEIFVRNDVSIVP